MKKIILVFLLVFAFVNFGMTPLSTESGIVTNPTTAAMVPSEGGTNIVFPTQQSGYEWQQVGNKCAGCASFFVGVTVSGPNQYGNYQYDVYLQSNSYDRASNPRMTYMSPVKYYYWSNSGWMYADAKGPNANYWYLVKHQAFHAYTMFLPISNASIKINVGHYEYR